MSTIKIKPDFTPHAYEHNAWAQNYVICGVDEVGRGCLAGPVVAAAVILKPYAHHELLRDSKLLSPKQRLTVYSWLQEHSDFAVSFVHHRIIDTDNIYRATMRAMKRAIMQLNITKHAVHYILVDAMPLRINHPNLSVIYFNYGERQSASIAAASVIAKVTRDMLMDRLDTVFHAYGFTHHKGYATVKHKQALDKRGTTIIHRNSFL